MRHAAAIATLIFMVFVSLSTAATPEDPFLWLEEVDGQKALEWVQQHNERTIAVLEKVPEFEAIRAKNLEIYNSRDRIPTVAIRGEQLYNYWQDAEHVRGIWRRTTLVEYRKDEPPWETVLDLDRLAAEEESNWVWKSPECLPPEYDRCLVALSDGGKDAVVYREFDMAKKSFVEGGFMIPEAKTRVSWRDRDTLWVATDFGEGSLTSSGYPRVAKLWKRGTSLDEATTVFEVPMDHVAVSPNSIHTPEGRYELIVDTPEFFRGTYYAVLGDRLVKLDLPEDANLEGFYRDHMLITLRTDWQTETRTYPQGALLAADYDAFLQGSRDFEVLFEPSERIALAALRRGSHVLAARTRDSIVIGPLDNVRGRLARIRYEDGQWRREKLALPDLGAVQLSTSSSFSDSWFFRYQDFLTPSTLYLVQGDDDPVAVKSAPSFFDSSGMRAVQYEATSGDGTTIPYFALLPKGFTPNGTSPTLLYGYGGFEVSQLPFYSGIAGSAWGERGGVWVLANIRGGGEFGPKWHLAALKEKRQLSFDDFIAVAEDLIERKITSPEHLGIMGGSQGGLLVGGAFAQRPELFAAVVSQVPLLDMKRFNKLLAGASWMAEYGNPDVAEDWEFIQTWSPYHLVREDAEYPEVFFRTNTHDDRVHPGHARKMVARMTGQGHEVYYFEDTEGGHSAGANNAARAYGWALDYSYLWMKLR